MQVLKPKEIITTISNLKTGEIYKDDKEWKAKGVPEADIRRDVKVVMPSLDLFQKPSNVIIQVFCLPYFKLNYNYDDIKNART